MSATTPVPLRPPTYPTPDGRVWWVAGLSLALAGLYAAVLVTAAREGAITGMPGRAPAPRTLLADALRSSPPQTEPCRTALAVHVRAVFAARAADAFPTRTRFIRKEDASLVTYETLGCPPVDLMVARTAALMAADEALSRR